MTTKFIGMKDFRQNMASYTKKTQQGNIRYIVLRKNIPVFTIQPVDELDIAFEELKKALDEAEKGKTYTQEEIMKEFGLL